MGAHGTTLSPVGRFRGVGLAVALAVTMVAVVGCSKDEGLRITKVTPSEGAHTGGDRVTIHGTGFQTDGIKHVDVYFGDKRATVLFFEGDTKLVVESPPGEAGKKVDIEVKFASAKRHVHKEAFMWVDRTGMNVDSLTTGMTGDESEE